MAWGSLRAKTKTINSFNKVARSKGLSQNELIELLLLKNVDGSDDLFIRRKQDEIKRKKR